MNTADVELSPVDDRLREEVRLALHKYLANLAAKLHPPNGCGLLVAHEGKGKVLAILYLSPDTSAEWWGVFEYTEGEIVPRDHDQPEYRGTLN